MEWSLPTCIWPAWLVITGSLFWMKKQRRWSVKRGWNVMWLKFYLLGTNNNLNSGLKLDILLSCFVLWCCLQSACSGVRVNRATSLVLALKGVYSRRFVSAGSDVIQVQISQWLSGVHLCFDGTVDRLQDRSVLKVA